MSRPTGGDLSVSTPPRVVGLDLSLSSTGVSDGRSVHAFRTKPDRTTEARLDELLHLCTVFIQSPSQWTDEAPEGTRADLVVVEGPAFGAKGNAVDQLAGLRWMVRHRLWTMGVPFAVVQPTALKLYTTGHGHASKADMVNALADRHGLDLTAHKASNGLYDMADAYALAAMGYAFLGKPLAVLDGHTPAEPPALDVHDGRANTLIPLQTGNTLR